jgi:hypothetical protein
MFALYRAVSLLFHFNRIDVGLSSLVALLAESLDTSCYVLLPT